MSDKSTNVNTYAAVGGMPKKKATEDFYFLQSLAKYTDIKQIKKVLVFPSSRNDQRVYLKNAHLIEDQASFHPFQSGLVARVSKEEGVVICTVGGLLVIHSVTSGNGKDITQTLKNGDRFFTPQKELENALLYRIDYNASGLKK